MIPALPTDMFRKGEVLNNTYEILGVLGRGGTGEVYKARNAFSRRIMAIKALSAEFSENQDALSLMRREEEMRMIAHDAIVRYSDSSRTAEGHVYLVMDFVDGPLLSDLMEAGGVSAEDLLVIAEKVCGGLTAAHGKGIVHRDLSPDNIILRGRRPTDPVIIDFGIAKDTAAGARTIVGNEFAGKYEYAAPEQLHGQATTASDLYGLGTTLLAAFRGEVPRIGTTPGEIVDYKMRPLDTAGVPEPLKRLIDWLCAPEAENRPPNAAAVVEFLHEARKPPVPWWQRMFRRVALVLGGLLLLGALAGALWLSGLGARFGSDGAGPMPKPFVLSAGKTAEGAARLAGYAPDEATAEALRESFRLSTGTAAAREALTVARGVPHPRWAEAVRLMLGAMALEEWSLEVADQAALIDGIAADIATRGRVLAALEAVPREVMDLTVRIAAGPRFLDPESVEAVADKHADCGPIRYAASDAPPLPLAEPVILRGAVAGTPTRIALGDALRPLIGDRPLRLELIELSPPICRIRAALPAERVGDIAIDVRHGDTGEDNPSGIFRRGDEPVIDVVIPDASAVGFLWVFFVNPDDTVFNVLPHADRPEHAVQSLGQVQDGQRRIRLTHSRAEVIQAAEERDVDLLRIEVSDGNFGQTEIYALQTSEPAFEGRRPITETSGGVAQAISEALAVPGTQLIGLTTRIVETRP